jgi:hypothetical protein
MTVVFHARPQQLAQIDPSLWYGLALFVVLLVGAVAVQQMRGLWVWLKNVSSPSIRPVSTVTPAVPDEPQDSGDQDDQNRRVSSDELL